MWNAGLHEAQAGIKIARTNINNLRYADNTTLMAESEEELKSLFIKMKEESKKGGLKLNIQKTKIINKIKKKKKENEDHGIWSHHSMADRWRNSGNKCQTLFWGAPTSLQMVIAAMKLKDACSLVEMLWPT